MPKHIVRLILLLVAAGVVALAGIKFLTVKSFYEYGHYRGDSVAEIAGEKPNYKGVAYCESCHAERVAQWSKGAHNNPDAGKIVRCEVCHGAAADSPRWGEAAAKGTSEHPKDRKMTVPADTRQLCTLCHERTAGRPADQPQIVVADHAGTQQCIVCHNPHSPKIASAAPAPAGNAAAGKDKAAACVGCHGTGVGPNLAGQTSGYFIEAFKAYSDGTRANPMMSGPAQGVSDADVANMAAYFAGLKCESALTADKQAAAPARAAAAKCVACHGADGVSSNPSWPSLLGFSKNQLADAVKAYRSGARKNAMMAGVVKDMSDADIDGVATYYAGAACK